METFSATVISSNRYPINFIYHRYGLSFRFQFLFAETSLPQKHFSRTTKVSLPRRLLVAGKFLRHFVLLLRSLGWNTQRVKRETRGESYFPPSSVPMKLIALDKNAINSVWREIVMMSLAIYFLARWETVNLSTFGARTGFQWHARNRFIGQNWIKSDATINRRVEGNWRLVLSSISTTNAIARGLHLFSSQ